MKKLFILLSIFFFLKGAQAQNYYFYEGKRIELEQRTDKMAIVLNSNLFTKDYLLRTISDAAGNSGDVKETSENIYLVNFQDRKTTGEIDNIILNLSSRNNLVKFATPVYYGESKHVTEIPTDEFVVRLRSNTDRHLFEILNVENNIQILGNVGDERGFLLKSNNDVRKNALELSDIYFNSGIFEFAEPNFLYPEFCLLNSTPNDANYPQQWALNNTGQAVPTGSASFGDVASVNGIPGADMDVNLAWDFTTGSSSVKVGVVDTGIDSTHPDFAVASHLLAGYDAYYNKYGVPRDSGSHGTCTAGLIGSVMNNAIGVAGIASGCQIMSLRIFNAAGSASDIGIGRAFDTARVKGISILSNSWGGGTPSAVVTTPINNAATSGRGGLGCIILFSSGNDGHNPPNYPSYLANVICVGASTTHDQKKSAGTGNQYYWGGSFGEDANGDLDLTAPTVCYTTDRQGSAGYNTASGTAGNYFSTFNGTSCSCPNAAGVAALVLSVNTSQTRLQVWDNIYRGCDKIDNVQYATIKTYGRWNAYYGYGRVNALNSVRLAAGVDVTPPTITHLNISSVTTTYPVSITAEILDQDGSSVPVTGANEPKLFYRLNKNNAGYGSFDSVSASSITGNNFTFKVPCVGYETQVQYYIRGRDNSGNPGTFPKGAPNAFWLCYYAVGTFNTATNLTGPFTALDANVSYSPNINFGSFTILNTAVRIYLRHTYVSDEIIQLVSPIADPSNNRKCLFSENGFDLDNITGSIIADSGNQFWNAGTPPWTNTLYKPDYVMKGYNGTDANGNWRILNYDVASGDVPNFDSVRITFTKTTGTTSASARLNSSGDSVLNFGTISYGDTLSKNFYLKNVGNANLDYSAVSFTGTYASKFSLLTSASGSIIPGDSGLFQVKLNSLLALASGSKNNTDVFEDALMNITNNDPDKSTFKVSLQSDNTLPTPKSLNLTAYLQGFYNSATNTMIGDTVHVYMRNNVTPFDVVDSATAYLDTNGNSIISFNNLSNGVNYYIQVKHRNALETWSNSPGQSFTADGLSYNFTDDSTKAYGSNMSNVNASPNKYAFYEGDVDHNGVIALTDITEIFNSSSVFTTGYVVDDINGDLLVNLNDITIAFNNSAKFVILLRP